MLLIITSCSFALNPAHFTITRITAPYFIVDGNSPTTITKAYVGFEVKNNSNSATTYTGLAFMITSIGTSVVNQNYAVLSPAGNQVLVGTLASGESKICYFYIQYPANVTPVATVNVKLADQTASNKTAAFTISNRSSISANAGGAATQSFTNQDALGGIITDDVTYAVGNAQLNDEVDFQISVSSLFDPTRMSLLSTAITASTVPGVTTGTTDSLYFKTGNGSNGQTVTVRWTFKIVGTNITAYILPCADSTSGNTNYKYALNSSLGPNGTAVTIAGTNPLTISKTSDKATYYTCETATFTLTIGNPGANSISIDSIKDQLPAGFTYAALAAGSGITAANSTSSPTTGATGNINFSGGVNSGGNISYFIAAGGSLQLKYTATAPCTAASNLSSTAIGYVGPTEFANSSYSVNVVAPAPLPLTWLSFTANQTEKNITLNWTTANEQNTKSFTVQHSSDGSNWTNAGMLNATGSGTAIQRYIFVHTAPLLGNNFYRLLQTDLDGRNSFSRVIKIITESKQSSFIVLSNPVVNGLVKIKMEKPATLHLVNAQGQIIFRKQLIAGVQEMNIGMLAPGIYTLMNDIEVQKILIQ